MLAALLALLLALAPAMTATAQTGAQAFTDGDYDKARAIWQESATAGDAGAEYGLGVLSDLGLGGPRDPARAFRHYLAAADKGHREAQFNVAVMIDAGTLNDPDPRAASVWYGRAAANGLPRAAYNLGVLYEEGIGVPLNAELARYWLSEAAEEVAAATDALDRLKPGRSSGELVAPTAQGGYVVDGDDGAPRAELVWTAEPDSAEGTFTVEIARLDPAGGSAGSAAIIRRDTEGSALAMPLPGPGRYAWRILRVAADQERYAASPWEPLSPSVDQADLPKGVVTLRIGADDGGALRLAEGLTGTLSRHGYIVSREELAAAPAESGVAYGFEGDAEAARRIASALPVIGPDAVERRADPAPRPGEIVVTLVGGLGPAPD